MQSSKQRHENWPDKRILVTGGAGFIGSALVWALNQRGCEQIVVSDRLGTDEKWRNLAPLRFEDYIEADSLMGRLQSSALGKFDLVLHLGACSSTTEKDASYLIRNNYEFTKELAVWSLTKKSRFVYASSAATYGNGEAGMNDQGPLHVLRPLNAYAYSKHLFDLYAQRNGFLKRIVGLKYFNVFGPNEDHKDDMRSVVHKSFYEAKEKGVIRLFKSYRKDFADGEQKRDFLYIKDAVQMTLHLAAKRTASGIYNLGSGEANTWNELARGIFTALGKKPRIEYIEMPDGLREKYQYFTRANLLHLRLTQYSPNSTPLELAIADYVKNYLMPNKRLGESHHENPSVPILAM